MKLRRVVTGHDAGGKAVVKIDELCRNVLSRRPKHSSCVVWTTESVPADVSADEDGASRAVATSDPKGTVFRVVQYEPGVAPRRHRTESIDYAVVVSGEIDMELDDGVVVHLRQGDTLVQRATIHNWVNRGDKPCVIAFVLIAARPVLDAVG
jgi:oxalate decarboxylase/phosphoglucose isomerase-like protein (cupin superfamily)